MSDDSTTAPEDGSGQSQEGSRWRRRKRPGPRRAEGMPTGPIEVRRAVIDAAAQLFCRDGVAEVTLRDVAQRARVNLGLISRYVGSRDDLVRATFADLSDKLTAEVRADPTAARGFESDSVMVCWTRILSHLVVVDPETAVELGRAPMEDLVAAAQDVYGQSEPAARLRVAQLMGSAMGWRLFEPFLMEAAGLDPDSIDDIRAELLGVHRRLAAQPLPSPPDPPERPGAGGPVG